MSGPLQVIAVRVGLGADFDDRFMAEVDRLQGRGVFRLLDLLLVAKNEDGTIERLAVGDDEDYGGLLTNVFAVDDAGVVKPAADEHLGFNPADAWLLAETLLPGSALVFLLIEHGWAQPLFDAVTETGGALLGGGFLTAEAGLLVRAEIAALDEAARVITAAQGAEADATLVALAAGARAAEAVATSEAIRAAAAASALRALINAGLVEEAAAHEAIDALSAAGLIVAVAEEEAADAIAEGAAIVRAASITLAQARVLRYLPTQMNFGVIAEKLGISRGAARERAERAYTKLGVHSRAEAVSRAREIGLID
jgi:DNA-binding NarL/FixJ family response regulator